MSDDALLIEPGDEWTAPDHKKKKTVSLSTDAPVVDLSKLPETKQEDVEMILLLLTGGADFALGKRIGASLTLTKAEIGDLAPPVTRIINRRPALRAMAAQGDLMDAAAIALGSIKYGVRITGEAFETARQRKAELLEAATEGHDA